MGVIIRHEPKGVKFMTAYPKVIKKLQKIGWLNFFEKFEGYDTEFTRALPREFDGVEAESGEIRLKVTETLLSKATWLSSIDENWFKCQKLKDESWKSFLQNQNMELSTFIKGIPVYAFKMK